MKNLQKVFYFAGLLILASFALLPSCVKEGTQGPAGVNGINGVNGTDGLNGQDANSSCLVCQLACTQYLYSGSG